MPANATPSKTPPSAAVIWVAPFEKPRTRVVGVAAPQQIGLLWWVLWATWSTPQPVTTARLAEFGVTAALTGLLWWLTGPVRKLPTQRVTLAGSAHLAFNELFGQLRTMPEGSGKDRRRIFAVVRHWGNCPVCSAEVDLDDGGRAFPERLVGRCHDAPTEHVFSFDPVRLVGQRLNR